MRNHDARVILAACLLSAAAAAQAPAFEDNRIRGWDPSNNSGGAPPAGAGLTDRIGRPTLADPQGTQDPQDYSLRGMFLDSHREFMDRRERYDPQLEIGARIAPKQRIDNEPGSFDWLGYDVDLESPFVVSPDGYLLFGAYYYGRRYVFSDDAGTQGNATGLADENLTAAGLKIGFGVFLDENWFFEVQSEPGVWTDADGGLHSEDFDFPSYALFTVRTMDNFFFKFGVRYNQIFEDAAWLPYLGFGWEIAEGFRLDVLAPETIEFSWWPNSSTGVLFGGEVTGAEYHVRTSEAAGKERDDLRVQEVIVYAGLMQRFNDSFSLSVRAGAIVAGDYELTTGASGFNPAEGSLDPAFYGDIYLGFDF
jgi:hypothetical protein